MMFFDTWHSLLRIVVIGVLAYAALVSVLRFSGKRTLSKLNAFDLVVTVALGSTFATVLLSKNVSLADGVLAFVVLALLQFVVAWTSLRSKRVETIAKASPRTLLIDGRLVHSALRDDRVTADEVLASVRGAGFGDLAQIAAVVLETDGSLSVVSAAHRGSGTALPNGFSN